MLATCEEMKRMDQRMVNEMHVSMERLMQQAAQALWDAIRQHYGTQHRFGIFCGSGNNGGDGYALALLMKKENVTCTVCAVAPARSTCAQFYEEKAKEQQIMICQAEQCEEVIDSCDILIDAIFGTGLARSPQGIYASVIQQLNQSGKTILSVDVPSGLGEDIFDSQTTIHAEETITFACMKKMMLPHSRRICCGKIRLVSIGIPKQLQICADPTLVLDSNRVSRMLPKRKAQSHKGTYGRVLVIGGSRNMSGALIMCTKALLRSGAGLVTCMLPSCIHTIVASSLQEAMFRVMKDDGEQMVVDPQEWKKELGNYDLIVVGNGMGRGSSTKQIVELVLASDVPCILDGDAIYETGQHHLLDLVEQKDVILTPHLKELSYLSTETWEEVRERPWDAAQKLVKRYPFLCLLAKDDLTWIFHKEKRALNIIGNNGLAKGGSGDVLCGMIAGLYAQSKDAFHSACAAVYAHAYSADHLLKSMDPMSMLPGDLLSQLPTTYQELRGK